LPLEKLPIQKFTNICHFVKIITEQFFVAPPVLIGKHIVKKRNGITVVKDIKLQNFVIMELFTLPNLAKFMENFWFNI
jgi:hypothetical protein